MARPKNTVVEYRSYFLPLHFPVLLLSGDYWRISDVPSGRLHFHNCLEIGICHSDSGTMEFPGQKTGFCAGDVTVVPRSIPHTTYSTPGCASHWSYIFIDPEELFKNLLPRGWTNYDLSPFTTRNFKYVLSQEEYPFLHSLIMAAVRELEEKRTGYQISARGLLLAFYVEIFRIQNRQAVTMQKESAPDNLLVIGPALDYVNDNYMQSFSVDDLADLCHLSSTHFRRLFHEIMGAGPLDFVTNTRISKACNLLRSTEHSILDISEMVGFRSITSFNRSFIKLMQTTPRDYRRQMAQTDQLAQNQSIQEYAGWMYPE
ncbi:MAG: helix-turn-helix domain-containing protein [Eubacteriales bacterium]|nr:helix-turn-helix domain-containing protein [Eubacteriales bacterium]